MVLVRLKSLSENANDLREASLRICSALGRLAPCRILCTPKYPSASDIDLDVPERDERDPNVFDEDIKEGFAKITSGNMHSNKFKIISMDCEINHLVLCMLHSVDNVERVLYGS